MTPLSKNNSAIIWGKVTRDPRLYYTRKGVPVAGFSIMYNKHFNVDGVSVCDFMEISLFGDLALSVADERIGIEKGDVVLLGGTIVEDTFYKDNEDRSVKKWKLNADFLVDANSIFQIAGSLFGTDSSDDEPTPKTEAHVEETDEKTPFDLDEEDLPY